MRLDGAGSLECCPVMEDRWFGIRSQRWITSILDQSALSCPLHRGLYRLEDPTTAFQILTASEMENIILHGHPANHEAVHSHLYAGRSNRDASLDCAKQTAPPRSLEHGGQASASAFVLGLVPYE